METRLTDQQFKQILLEQPKEQLMNFLLKTKQAYQDMWPFICNYAALKDEYDKAKKTVDEGPKANVKVYLIVTIALFVFSMFMFITSGSTDVISGFGRKIVGGFALFFALCAAGFTLINVLVHKSGYKSACAKVKELEPQRKMHDKMFNDYCEKYSLEIATHRTIFPKNCGDLRHIQIFVEFFENGRADSLKEAYALYDELIHRERMEGHAQAQTQAALATEAAARAAASAASSAAVSAAQTATWTRFKD